MSPDSSQSTPEETDGHLNSAVESDRTGASGQTRRCLLTTVKLSFDLSRTSEDEGCSSRQRTPLGLIRNTPADRQTERKRDTLIDQHQST